MERTYFALTSVLVIFCFCAVNVAAADSTPQVYNNYSFIPPGAPNHVVAQGSIFAIKNSIGPAQFSALQPTPTAGFGGVTITVTVNGTTVTALNYYVGPQLAGVLPSNTPTGEGTYTVTYNGQTTAPEPITVVQNSFGILTMDSSGQGEAKVCDYNFDKTCTTFVSLAQSAKPGDVITIWGSGLGPTASDAINVDMTNTVPVEVWIGGQQAHVDYAGRSQFVGLDLINTSIPVNVSGCYVSVVVKIGDNVSNTTYLPVEQNGGACADTRTGLSGTDLQGLFSKGTLSFGGVTLSRITTAQGTSESAGASFERVQTAELASLQQAFPQASIGSCTVWTLSTDITGKITGLNSTPLDAGTVTVTSGSNSKTLTRDATSGTYTADLGSGGFLGASATAAGSGGADVGSFSATTSTNIGFAWTNSAAVSTVIRASGQEIDWSGAAPNSFVIMTGTSFNLDLASQTGAFTTFTCIEDGAKNTFTIPSTVLLAVPPSASGLPISLPGSLSVSNATPPVRFTATGLDFAFLESLNAIGKNVTYQ